MINSRNFIVGLILIFGPSFSVVSSASEINGAFWKRLEPSGKALYLRGLYDSERVVKIRLLKHLIYGLKKESEPWMHEKLLGSECFDENFYPDVVIPSVDGFYEDYKNVNIRVLDAVCISRRLIEGESEADLAPDIEGLRAWSAKKSKEASVVTPNE